MSCYIDPGAGSIALQFAVAGFFAALYVLKRQWQRLWAWARRQCKR